MVKRKRTDMSKEELQDKIHPVASETITAEKEPETGSNQEHEDSDQAKAQVENVNQSVSDQKHEAQDKIKRMAQIEAEFKRLHEKAIHMGLTDKDFSKMEILKVITWNGSYYRVIVLYVALFVLGLALLGCVTVLMYLLEWPFSQTAMLNVWFGVRGVDIHSEPCVIDIPETLHEMFRPPVECSFCEGLTEIETVFNISKDEFESDFAYSGVPVIIGDGTKDWTAPKYFSFEFFKEIYYEGSPALDNQEKHCQFFPYKTQFEGLSEVMNMSLEQARMEDGSKPWYVGWSNCDFSAANTLRRHYERPYFLPELSECSKTDWIFMGSPGYGAHLHIDNVGNPSWQAQIKGTKKWRLEPPPECYYTCPDYIEVIVHPGQIIVLDTNIWYHSTLNVGDDISITIGSEFD